MKDSPRHAGGESKRNSGSCFLHQRPPAASTPHAGHASAAGRHAEASPCTSPSGSQGSRAQCTHLKAGIKRGARVFHFPSLNSPKIPLCSHQSNQHLTPSKQIFKKLVRAHWSQILSKTTQAPQSKCFSRSQTLVGYVLGKPRFKKKN